MRAKSSEDATSETDSTPLSLYSDRTSKATSSSSAFPPASMPIPAATPNPPPNRSGASSGPTLRPPLASTSPSPASDHQSGTRHESTASAATVPAPSPSGKPAFSDADPHFNVCVASNLRQVQRAWRLLHDTYVEAGYIAANNHRMHTVPEAVGAHTAVMLGKVNGQPVSTISAIGDNHKGLPLDEVYPRKLDAMREQGCQLIEVGLLGDRPGQTNMAQPGFAGVLELMRYASFFALAYGATDMVCGIPPRRARLYHRMLGFEQCGQTRCYSTVKGNPVALLKLNLATVMQNHQRFRGIDYFINHPVDCAIFEKRFRFGFDALLGSKLGSYLYGFPPRTRPSDRLTVDQAQSEVSGRIESGRVVYAQTPPALSEVGQTLNPSPGKQAQHYA